MLYPAFANDIQKWHPYKMNKMLTFANILALSVFFLTWNQPQPFQSTNKLNLSSKLQEIFTLYIFILQQILLPKYHLGLDYFKDLLYYTFVIIISPLNVSL